MAASDKAAASRWRSQAAKYSGRARRSLAPASLEAAIMSLAVAHPEYVTVGA